MTPPTNSSTKPSNVEALDIPDTPGRVLVADDELLNYLRKRSLLAIVIDNPKYSGLQQARARWGEGAEW